MRQRSLTNSRREEDGGLRARYAMAHKLCELTLWIPEFQVEGNSEVPANETNHIFSAGGRHDLKSNLIRLSWYRHRWFHERPADGRVCCLWVKHQKGELDLDEIRKASGSYLAGWLLRANIRESFSAKYLEELRRIYE